MNCNKCGAELLENSNFCRECGTKVEKVRVNRKKTKPYWLIVLVPVILFIMSLIFGFFVDIITYDYELYMDPVYFLFDIENAFRTFSLIALVICTIITICLYVRESKRK